MGKIKLYQFESCPYCEKVRQKLAELDIEYEKINVSRDQKSDERKDIAEKSGVLTVPVIEIDGKFIGESEIIVEELETRFGRK